MAVTSTGSSRGVSQRTLWVACLTTKVTAVRHASSRGLSWTMTGFREPWGVKHRVDPWVSGLPGTHTVIDLGNALTLAVDELPASHPHAAVGGGDLPAVVVVFTSLVEDQFEAHSALAEEPADPGQFR